MTQAWRWRSSVAVALVVCGLTWAAAAPSKRVSDSDRKGAPTAPVAEAQQLIVAVSALARLSRPEVEKLLRVPLRSPPDSGGDPNLWQANLSNGPFSVVRLLEPRPGQKFGPSLSLLARDGDHLTKVAFDPRFVGPIVDVNPDIPPEGTVSHLFVATAKPGTQAAPSGTTTVLEFWGRSQRLRQVTIRHPPAVATGDRPR